MTRGTFVVGQRDPRLNGFEDSETTLVPFLWCRNLRRTAPRTPRVQEIPQAPSTWSIPGQLQLDVRASQCSGLANARNSSHNSKNSLASANVSRNLFFMPQTTHNPEEKNRQRGHDTGLASRRCQRHCVSRVRVCSPEPQSKPPKYITCTPRVNSASQPRT